MRRLKHLKALLMAGTGLFLLASCGSSYDSHGAIQAEIQKTTAARLASFKAANGLPDRTGILVHLVTPSGTWTVAENLPAGTTENSRYRIASVTKTFTAAAIMLLDQNRQLSIGSYISEPIPGSGMPYLPDVPDYRVPYRDQITISQLLSHRAGVFDVSNDPVPADKNVPYKGEYYINYVMSTLQDTYHQFTFDEMVGVAALNQLSHRQPGDSHHYSNTGYSMLGKIIERVSGMSYERYVTENFLGPLHLDSTSAPWNANDRAIPAPAIIGYSRQESGQMFTEMREDNISANVGEGNLISSPADAVRWMQLLVTGKGPLEKAQVDRMTTIPPGNESALYGLGLVVAPLGIGHTGAHPGYLNLVAFNPRDNVGVVVMLNCTDFSNLAAAAGMLAEIAVEARRIAGFPTPAQGS